MDETTDNAYIHGTTPEEQERLTLMNGILNSRCLAELGLEGGERVLEIGAGTGIFAADLARAVGPAGHVVAVEQNEDQLRVARERASRPGESFDLRAGDAYRPPLSDEEWQSFDLVHTRFLLEHLERPLEVVQAMVRAARPGGRIALIDDDHSLMRFWPDPGGMSELWSDYATQYERLGSDPNVGRKLVSLLVDAGAQPTRTAMIYYGACAGEENFEAVAVNLADVVGSARKTVVEGTDWTEESFQEAIDRYMAWTQLPDASIWYSLPCAIGSRIG